MTMTLLTTCLYGRMQVFPACVTDGMQSCNCNFLTWLTLALGARSVQKVADCISSSGAVSSQLPVDLTLLQLAKAECTVSLHVGAPRTFGRLRTTYRTS